MKQLQNVLLVILFNIPKLNVVLFKFWSIDLAEFIVLALQIIRPHCETSQPNQGYFSPENV